CQSLGGSVSIWSTAANSRNPSIGLDHVTLTTQQKSLLFVRDEQQRFQVPQKLVGTPILGQFDRAPANVAMILLQLRFKPAEQRKRVGGRAGETCQNLILIKP